MLSPNSSSPGYEILFNKDVVQLVNTSNIHNHTATCYKYSRARDNPTCRMRMPRQLVDKSSIDIDSGEIKLKRLHATINNFNEYIISACRSNMDIKYIFSGSDAKALVYYITDYVTKSSLSFYDTFSLVLKAIVSLEKSAIDSTNMMSAEERSRRLVLRCYNTLASQQELSGVQVASYLMGWPDHYTTHEFAKLYLISIENYLQAALVQQQIQQQRRTTGNILESHFSLLNMFHFSTDNVALESEEEVCTASEEQFLLQPDEAAATYVFVNTRIDYQYRSTALQSVCLYDYIRFYRKKVIDANDRKQFQALETVASTEPQDSRRGRPRSERERFQTGHPQTSTHVNVKRTTPVVPVLLGPPIPRRDRDEMRERYCRSILTLFTPWRSVVDVCDVDQTWEQAFETRQASITAESRKFIENIQLLQECKKDRDEHLQQVIEAAQTETIDQNLYPSELNDGNDEENDEILDVLASIDMEAVPSLDMTGMTSEEKYFQKTLQAIDQAKRFLHIGGKNVCSPENKIIFQLFYIHRFKYRSI